MRVAVVVSRYHEEITSALRSGAEHAFLNAGGDRENFSIIYAPGTFELPIICSALAEQRSEDEDRIDAIVALGCVIRGETTHNQYINHAVSTTLARIAAEQKVAIGFGVLTCQDIAQARARAGGDKGNKGVEAMQAAIETAQVLRQIATQTGQPLR